MGFVLLEICPFVLYAVCLSFLELRILITPLVSSNSSSSNWGCVGELCLLNAGNRHYQSVLLIYNKLFASVDIIKRDYKLYLHAYDIFTGADPGFQVRRGEGAQLKKLRRVEGGANNFGVFRVKNYDFTPKNHIFFHPSCAPSWIRPW